MYKSLYKPRLLAPGPVEVPPEVLTAMSRQTMHHRSEAFSDLLLDVRAKLAQLALVPDDVLILSASGSAGFEAGLLASVPQGAKVIGINAGKFGARWVDLARNYNYEVVEIQIPWGDVADPDQLRDTLKAHPDVSAIMTTHSETSTGALHDIQALAQVAHEEAPDALILVDCVTSLSVTELKPIAWELDGVFSGSQKGLMLPPGLAFAWLSERAWKNQQRLPSFYLDLAKEREKQAQGQTAYTPAINLIYGLQVALEMLLSEGLETVWQRRKQNNTALLEAGKALSCLPFAKRPSPALAAMKAPTGLSAPEIVRAFAKRNIRIAGGQDQAKPVLFRPSVLGYADAFDVITLVAALEQILMEMGQPIQVGQGLCKAQAYLSARA